jgi:hypothetical protein
MRILDYEGNNAIISSNHAFYTHPDDWAEILTQDQYLVAGCVSFVVQGGFSIHFLPTSKCRDSTGLAKAWCTGGN